MSPDTATRNKPDALTRLLALGRPAVMGILNVTPDSFSDGGQFNDPAAAIAQARRMAAEGADILDIGAESTRPYGGMKPVPLEEEIARLAPVLPEVVRLGVPVSIDTIKAKTASWALDQGAAIVNDVWGLQRDPDMARVVAEHGVPVIVMHNREAADPAHRHHGGCEGVLFAARSRSRRAPASRASASCSIPASASARRRSRASR